MKIVDKPASLIYLIQCGCGKEFEHQAKRDLVFCISCGMKGRLSELTKDEPKATEKEDKCHEECS